MTSDKSLQEIWAQVPPDYYQRGVAGNLLQRLWHGHKLRTLARILPRRPFGMVADVGCAGGYMAAQIARLLPVARWEVLDLLARYKVPSGPLTSEALERELAAARLQAAEHRDV